MDLSGFGLDEETQNKIMEAHNASISGLKNKNSDLVEREGKHKLALEEHVLKSAEDIENAKVALAEKEGSIENYKIAVADKDEALSSLRHEFQQKENDRLINDEKSLFSKSISDDRAAQVYMIGIFEESVEVRDGKVQPKDVSMTMDSLVKGLVSDNAYASYVKAPVGSGSGSAGSNGGASSKSFGEMTATEKAVLANTNPELYNQHTRA